MTLPINEEALNQLACPVCKERPAVKLSDSKDRLICTNCNKEFLIADNGIAKLLTDDTPTE